MISAAYQQIEGWDGSAERLSNLFDPEPYTRPDQDTDLYHKVSPVILPGQVEQCNYNAHDALWHVFA